jgi:hypothetical protein
MIPGAVKTTGENLEKQAGRANSVGTILPTTLAIVILKKTKSTARGDHYATFTHRNNDHW